MNWEEFCELIKEAKRTAENGDSVVRDVAHLCEDRLQIADVPHTTLVKFKRELRRSNIHTGEWQ